MTKSRKKTPGRTARRAAANKRPPRADALPGPIKYKAPEANDDERPLAKIREEAKLKRRADKGLER